MSKVIVSRVERRPGWVESLVVGVLVFGLIGTAAFVVSLASVVVFIRSDTTFGSFYRDGLEPRLLIAAASSAAVVGTLAWRFIGRSGASRKRGALAGAVTGIAAHPVCGMFFIAGEMATLGKGVIETISSIPLGFVLFSISSLLLLGWISAPLGALLGYLTAVAVGFLRGPDDGVKLTPVDPFEP